MVFGLVILSLFAGATLALRHPFHVTIAEAQVNINERGNKVLEVALRVEPDELELAIERRIDRKFKLETAPDADKLIVAYLDDVFRVRHPATAVRSKRGGCRSAIISMNCDLAPCGRRGKTERQSR